jgi:hypothetical protein
MTAIRFSGAWPWWFILMVGAIGSLWIARWYWRESRHLSNPVRWLLPTLRASAFFLILFMLAGPTLFHQYTEGQLSRIRVLLDVSPSMATVDIDQQSDSRLDQVAKWLTGDDSKTPAKIGWLHELQSHHRVELFASATASRESLLWASRTLAPPPNADSFAIHGADSALGDFLASALIQNSSDNLTNPKESDGIAAVVLITDGQSNSGMSLSDASLRFRSDKIPVFTIGVGSDSEPTDLGILNAEHSQRLNRQDTLKGTVLVKERCKVGTKYQLQIKSFDQIFFSKVIESLDEGPRSIEFEIPAEPLVDQSKKQLLSGIDYASVPIDLRFSIDGQLTEVSLENNSFSSSLWGVDRKNRVLILDHRGGWEMRYIKNAMERDATWETVVSIGQSAFEQEFFPSTRAKLFEFDLIMVTFDTVRKLSDEQQTWIADFVGVSGGGLILIDSKREGNRPITDSLLSPLLPVRSAESPSESGNQTIQVGPSGINQPAFQLGSNSLPNDQVWAQLPIPKSIRAVTVEPGAEMMVELVSTAKVNAPQPFVATKLFGQGRVIYFASDETWRWRANVADLYHQRFWNQIATWGMRAPFAVNDAYASLDSGSRIYSTGDSITVRAKLKTDDAQPLENAMIQAVLERDGVQHSAFPLSQESDARGFYRATFGSMAEGSYDVRLAVVGIPSDALTLRTQFIVRPPIGIEMQSLACNTESLRQTATMTGGEFAMLNDAATISEKLKQFRTGKIIESQTLLWQSSPWFATIMGLLAIEWYLRKRAGLI